MNIGDAYEGGTIEAGHIIMHDNHDVMALVLTALDRADPGRGSGDGDSASDPHHYALYMMDIDPLLRIRWERAQGHQSAWNNICENIYDLLYFPWVETIDDIPIMMPSTLAVAYDANMRNVLGRRCGEHPVFRLSDPAKTYRYEPA